MQLRGGLGERREVGDREAVLELSQVHLIGFSMLITASYRAQNEDVLHPCARGVGSRAEERKMRATSFNHVSIHAQRLEDSVRFYEEIFGMEKIPTYNFAFPVQYLRLGDLQLHLFERESPAPVYHHIGINVDDFEAAYRR